MKQSQSVFCQNGEITLDYSEVEEAKALPERVALATFPSNIQVKTSSSFACGPLRQISANPMLDGRKLAAQCLANFRPQAESAPFVPQLLILIVSPAYFEIPLLPVLQAGIEFGLSECGNIGIPLIVCAYRENVFQDGLAVEGAILICMASCINTEGMTLAPLLEQSITKSDATQFGVAKLSSIGFDFRNPNGRRKELEKNDLLMGPPEIAKVD